MHDCTAESLNRGRQPDTLQIVPYQIDGSPRILRQHPVNKRGALFASDMTVRIKITQQLEAARDWSHCDRSQHADVATMTIAIMNQSFLADGHPSFLHAGHHH